VLAGIAGTIFIGTVALGPWNFARSPAAIPDRRREPRHRAVVEDAACAASTYDRYFQVVPATTPELLDAAYRLRYQVYCVEHRFEDPAASPEQRETDTHDSHSVHAILLHRYSAQAVGCVRLVLPVDRQGVASLPIWSVVESTARRQLETYDPAFIGEISRYAVSRAFRHRPGENLYPDVTFDRRLVPHMSLGLLRAIAELAASRHIRTVCAAMSPALLRMLGRLGMQFDPLGPAVDYHGLRQPCIANCEVLLNQMAASRAPYARLLEQAYRC
jgi:N-acyl amino acid synthase of PEP-CTERM/exosortase system